MKTELSAFASDVFGTAGLPDKPDFPVLFVAPLGDAVPEDGAFSYTTVTSLSDIGAVEERSVILFAEHQNVELAVLCKHGEQFGRSIQSLFGVPGSSYGPWFDDATFGIDRIAYGAFVAELRAASEIAAQNASAARSGTDIERDRYTKGNGAVRYSQDIGVGDDSHVDE